MNTRPVIFDLDGTVSDPSEGITKSINYALTSLQAKPYPSQRLLRFIGPPLKKIFSELLQTDDDQRIMQAVLKFRERYGDIGYRENILYPGMVDLLNRLHRDKHPLYIVTSKRTDIAENVADYFNIDHLFKGIYGCGLNAEKSQVLSGLISGINIRDNMPRMVGDRGSDILAAKQAGIESIGVTWGFGSRRELEGAGADAIVDSLDSLHQAVQKNIAGR